MQAVSGAHLTDPNGIAQLSVIDLTLNQVMHSFFRKTFTPQIQAFARSVERRRGIPGCCLRASLGGARKASVRRTPRWIPVFGNMMIDLLRVCHLWFQNEVIGGET